MSETAVQRSPRFTEAQIHRALVEVAACSGNTTMAERQLREDKDAPNIDQVTLWRWSKRTKVEQYERIRAEALPVITAQAAEQHMALAQFQTEIAAEAAVRVRDRLPGMEDRDLINAMGKADIGSGIHTEKAALLAGQPTHRVARDASEVLRELQAAGFKGEVEEVVDAQVVEEQGA
jgi:hypothetical protein